MHELKTFVANEGNGVKGLSELKIKTLPKLFIQPLEKRLDMSKVLHKESIPVIDMSNYEDPEVMDSICDAAEKWGFFQIVNHDVPLSVLEDVKKATYRFFDLPADEKKKYLFNNSPTKNVRLLTSFIPEVDKVLEWKDYLSCFYVSDDEAMTFWPSVCRDQVLEYMNKSESLIKRLLEILIKRLGITKLDETNQPFLMGSRRMNLNYYPICPNPELTVGVGGHSDVSTLTVLLQDETGGLYVRKLDSDNWVHVPPIKGSLTINIGDALQIMSNGRYKSIEHHVVANMHENRISVPIFVNPRPNDVIGPLPEVIKRGEKTLYKQVLYSDYVKHFYRKSHNGKDTIDFAKYLHNGVHGKSTLLPRTSGSASSVSDLTRSDLDMLQSLLAKFGLKAPNTSTPYPPVTYTVFVPPGFPSVSAQLSAQPTYVSPQLLPGSFGGSNMGMAGLFPQGVQYPTGSLQHGVYYPQQGVQTLSGPRKGFTLYMDLHSRQFSLRQGFNSSKGVLSLVWFTWDSHLLCLFIRVSCLRPVHKDFITRWVLLRCDSMGDLYPVTKPSTITHAFLISQYTWHQRLGHPGSEVLRRLVSSDSISCNKEKLPVLCHACQL
nr:feruloyl CoA ortho-hydroxylase 1-like [Tanacetum cinerariifolium]